MNLIVALEEHFIRTDDRKVWTAGTSDHRFWERYLEVFDTVQPLARVSHQAHPDAGWHEVTGSNVSVIDLPDFHGPTGFARSYLPMRRMMADVDTGHSAVLMRAPGMVSNLLRSALKPADHPFGVEVIGDPWDVFATGAVEHPLRPILRRQAAHELRTACKHAAAVCWENAGILPKRYPASDGAFATHCSSVELAPCHFVPAPRVITTPPETIHLVTVASLAQPYKGIDILLQAMKHASPALPGLSLTIVGDGVYRDDLERQADALGLSDRVNFLGQVPPGDPVRSQLDQADVFVLPSRTEGLPRAIIEAMARGLPCISTRVGGIPELLDEEDLVTPADPIELAEKLVAVATNPNRLTRMSARNLIRSHEYAFDVLASRQSDFYRHLRNATQAWISRKEVA